MNLPSGSKRVSGVSLKEFKVKSELEKVLQEKLSGYLSLTIDGYQGFEDGILVFRDGKFVAASYEYLKQGISFEGDEAAKMVFNAFSASNGILDISELDDKQLELAITFNSKSELKIPIEKSRLRDWIVEKFSTNFALKALSQSGKEDSSKAELFKKLGFGSFRQ